MVNDKRNLSRYTIILGLLIVTGGALCAAEVDASNLKKPLAKPAVSQQGDAIDEYARFCRQYPEDPLRCSVSDLSESNK